MLSFLCWGGCGKQASTLESKIEKAIERPASDTGVPERRNREDAVDAIVAGNFVQAERSIRKELLVSPNDAEMLLLAGQVAGQLGKHSESIDFHKEAIRQTDFANQAFLDRVTLPLVKRGRIFDAIEVLHCYLDRFDDSVQARVDLSGLATMVGMPEVAIPQLRWLLQHNHADMESVRLMANPNRSQPDLGSCKALLSRSGADLRLRYPIARVHAADREWNKVSEQLEPVVQQHPDFVPAIVLHARALVELGREAELHQLIKDFPNAVEETPGYWIVIGKMALAEGDAKDAAEAFLKVDQLSEPGCSEYLDGLYRSLVELAMKEQASLVQQKMNSQVRLRDALNVYLGRDGRSQTAAFATADALVALGRIWEGEAWARHATTLSDEPVSDLKNRHRKIRSKLKSGMPWVQDELRLSHVIRLSNQPDETNQLAESAGPLSSNQDWQTTKSRYPTFRDESQRLGFRHTCKLAAGAEEHGHWLHQSSGGGVAAIDFDLDSQVDIAVANLDGDPMQSNSTPNGLYRNVGKKLISVGDMADYADRGFSQGIAVGDVNSDGFDDILDANIGQNRLYINNGDGTFCEVAQEMGLVDSMWTVSAAIADLNGDGNADLFATNYCDGPKPFDSPCLENDRHTACAPLLFPAQPDAVWSSNGDGTFSEVTEAWMTQETPGRGLGIVVANLDERPGLDIYVANDMTANHLWSPSSTNGTFQLVDLASVRGVAVNAKSQSQASMGIAFGDADDDGDFDLYLTHFSSEYHTYYEQVRPGFWSDRSFQRGLAQATLPMLGFGTQWCDFDNDGAKELIVTNGHVDDPQQPGLMYRMPGQVFRRKRDGRWEDCDRNSLGEYFHSDHLGRALAIADLDRDGRQDVLITHLYEPVALLMNRTPAVGNSVSFRLKSTRTHRDAIGARLTMHLPDRTVFAMLTSGDGYMCSNQRRINFGVGEHEQIEKIVIEWPSGMTQAFSDLDTNAEHLLVEGREPFMLNRFVDTRVPIESTTRADSQTSRIPTSRIPLAAQ